jgi:TatD DNase family protein
MIDSHAHIYLEAFKEEKEEVIERALSAGVTNIFMPNIDHTSVDDMLEMEEKNKGICFSMMGLHPCSVNKHFEKELYVVEEWLAKKDFLAVGEIGTDLYWDKSFWNQQQEAFKIQVKWAKEKSLPIVIHCRESIDETIEMVQEFKDENLTGVFHCFAGDLDQARKIIDLGDFYLGIGGVSTFKNGGLDKVLPDISLDHLLLETDSPYLAPVPYRGKRNEPAYLPLVASRIAELLKTDEDEVKEKTTANAKKLFKL